MPTPGTNLAQWIGRQEEIKECLATEPARRLAAIFDRSNTAMNEGDLLPPMWQWLYFLPAVRQSELGTDGHPRRGGFLPPVPLPRRMFAGGRATFHMPLHIGESVSRRAMVADVRSRKGRSGSLIFVTIAYEYRIQDEVAAVEEQDVVYTGVPREAARDEHAAAIPDLPWRHSFRVDPVLLFRFSAVTFNAHRIHFDRPYSTDVEGYPGLVIHGPLLALQLLELLRHHSERAVRNFSFRARAPLFDDNEVVLVGGPTKDKDGALLFAYSSNGRLAMESSVALGTKKG